MTTQDINKQFVIKSGINGLGVFASNDIQRGEVILVLTGLIVENASRTSIQIETGCHVENELGALLNHSCHANAKIDRKTKSLVSATNIKEGDEITFNYNDNEDILFSPFICSCCGKLIEGKQRGSV